MTFLQRIGGRKFLVLWVSLLIFTTATTYILLADMTERGTTIVSVATGITMIAGSYIAGNVMQKNKEI